QFEPGGEWIIGLLLLVLAVIGALASFFMAKIPPAAPDRHLTWKLWQPLRANLGDLLRSKPLGLAVLGIAFFTFMVLFARRTLLYDGRADKELQAARSDQAINQLAGDDDDDVIDLAHKGAREDQKSEMRVAFLIAFISLGIGVGAPIAGSLSGNKVELGLVPIGAVFLIL